MTKITEVRAKYLYNYAKSRNLPALYSWDLEAEDAMIERLWDSHGAYMDALRAGVNLGLFEKPIWVGTGMTLYARSARRNRMFKLKQ